MKKVLCAVAVLAAGVAVAGIFAQKPLSRSVGVTSTMILGPALPPRTNAWAASTALAEETIINHGEHCWWVLSAGTTWTNGPTHYDGDATNGTATLRYIHARRGATMLSNIGTANVYLAYGNPAEVNKGRLLRANGAAEISTEYQGAIYGISTAGTTNTILIHPEGQ